MATALHSSITMDMFNNHCGEPDMDAFVDFSAMPSPTVTHSKAPASVSHSALTSPATTIMPLDHSDDLQTPAKPSHEYERWKQQTGLPTNSVPGLQPLGQPAQGSYLPAFSSSGISFDDMTLGADDSWSNGLRIDSDLMDFSLSSNIIPTFFPPSNSSSQSDDFVDPTAIATPEEPKANIRVWPGMHQQQAQQAALAKAQAHAQQQRQQMIQHQQQQKQQQPRGGSSRRSAPHHPIDPRVEETISRVVNQIRQSSALASQSESPSPQTALPHIIRMKKDDDDMDEDERLLASEEGKKLTSKERRQLRNKVSARAFRSRRKEYISQLEGEVALKTSECNDLRNENRALMEENARSRAFIEKLLRHQAFKPFLEDLSRDETIVATPTSVPSHPAPTRIAAPAKKDIDPFTVASQQQFQELTQPENPQIGMALVPEPQLDMSMLNLNNNWALGTMSYFRQPQVFSVIELPDGPASPIDTNVLSGKGYDSSFSDSYEAEGDLKVDYPIIERPGSETEVSLTTPSPVVEETDEEDPLFALYVDSPAFSSTSLQTPSSEDPEPLQDGAQPGKGSHFELVVSEGATDQALEEHLERMIARIMPVLRRVEARTAHLDL